MSIALLLSDNSDDESEDVIPIKKAKPSKKQQGEEIKTLVDVMASNIQLFLSLRHQDTNIHPSKDPAVVFLCRMLKQFMMRDVHKLYSNKMLDALQNKYMVTKSTRAKFKIVLTKLVLSSKCFQHTYLRKKDRESRCLHLNKNHREYRRGLTTVRRVHTMLKYGAWQFDVKEKLDENAAKHWTWVGADGIEGVTDGKQIIRVNDIVSVNSEEGIGMRPWVARIIRMYDNDSHEKFMTLRWFWFFNQLMDTAQDASVEAASQVEKRAKELFSRVTPCDIFESAQLSLPSRRESVSITHAPVGCIAKKVYVASSKSKYRDRIDTECIFRCDYDYDPVCRNFSKKSDKKIRRDAAALQKELSPRDECVAEEDDDVDLTDIQRNSANEFTLKKGQKPIAAMEEFDESDIESDPDQTLILDVDDESLDAFAL